MSKVSKHLSGRKAIPGSRIIAASKLRAFKCDLNCHSDGPGYNDHSGNETHNKACP